jgi:2-polyprenyl-3-methyl-5-hydroxy-6-metoxy-1,4-benzoquinol methylase
MAFLSRLRTRERRPELMDDPALNPAEHRRALAALARINRVTNSTGVLWPPVRDLARKLGRKVYVLDVATGCGDVPTGLRAKAKQDGVPIEVVACDVSPRAIAEAECQLCGGFFIQDALHYRLPIGFDVVTCSLFLHHLDEDEAATLLVNMAHATRHLVLVNDLARSRFNYCAVWAACNSLTRSRVVRFDGPTSVRSAFRPTEALALAERAGLHGATVRTRFPCRFLLSWERK